MVCGLINCSYLGLSSRLEPESPKNPENISFVHLVRKKGRNKKKHEKYCSILGGNEVFVIHHNKVKVES